MKGCTAKLRTRRGFFLVPFLQDSPESEHVLTSAITCLCNHPIPFSDNAGQDAWTKEFDSWRSAISEHDKMMQNWRKTWVRLLKTASCTSATACIYITKWLVFLSVSSLLTPSAVKSVLCMTFISVMSACSFSLLTKCSAVSSSLPAQNSKSVYSE